MTPEELKTFLQNIVTEAGAPITPEAPSLEILRVETP